jgi:AraC-like DNA-binding protein
MHPRSRPSEWSTYALAPDDSGIELLHAHFARHRYERHSHGEYAIGVTETGVQAFNCRGAHQASTAGCVIGFNPDEPHDGHAGDPADGFTYRMLYVPEATIRAALADMGRPGAPRLRAPIIHDRAFGAALIRLHDALSSRAPRLEREARLIMVVRRLARHHADVPFSEPVEYHHATKAMRRVRDFLHEAPPAEDVSTDDLARVSGMSRFHTCRVFRKIYGLPPHAWRMQLRLAAAKRMLLRGEAPADVAAALGFADQSHFHRRFKGAYGITPASFTRAGAISG